MKPAVFLLCAATLYAQTTGTDQTGGVTGIVRDALTHLPLKKVMVSINAMGRNPGAQAVATDIGGAFTIPNLQAGSHQLIFQHPSYPQARFGGVNKIVSIKPGETTGPVTVELIPGAAISGRVVDEDGDPIQNCFVQPHPVKNPDQGVPIAGNPSSNEDGVYRFYSVPPGKYVLTAQCQMPVFQPRPFSAGPEPPPARAYPPQYYPLASDAKSAEAVEVTPGTEKSGVDFRMRPAAVTQVRGAFSPSGADWRGRNPLVLQLRPLDPSRRSSMSAGATFDASKGTFEFRQVFPGSYVLIAFSNDSNENRIGVTQRIEVADQPLTVMLDLRQAVELSGKVEIEANASGGGNNSISLGQFGIQLVPQYQGGLPFPQAQVGDDGSFTLRNVIPGIWTLRANGPLAFLKSAWLGSTEITNIPLDLSNGASGALKIVLSTNTATIRGLAPAGQMVFAQRLDDDPPFRFNRATQSDQSGQYKLVGLPPGRYRLMLTDSAGPVPDEGGQEVTVREGETVMFDPKAPPVQ